MMDEMFLKEKYSNPSADTGYNQSADLSAFSLPERDPKPSFASLRQHVTKTSMTLVMGACLILQSAQYKDLKNFDHITNRRAYTADP